VYEDITPLRAIGSTPLYAIPDGMLSYARLLLPFLDLIRMRYCYELEHRAKEHRMWQYVVP
jgi:hypothetical protein